LATSSSVLGTVRGPYMAEAREAKSSQKGKRELGDVREDEKIQAGKKKTLRTTRKKRNLKKLKEPLPKLLRYASKGVNTAGEKEKDQLQGGENTLLGEKRKGEHSSLKESQSHYWSR